MGENYKLRASDFYKIWAGACDYAKRNKDKRTTLGYELKYTPRALLLTAWHLPIVFTITAGIVKGIEKLVSN